MITTKDFVLLYSPRFKNIFFLKSVSGIITLTIKIGKDGKNNKIHETMESMFPIKHYFNVDNELANDIYLDFLKQFNIINKGDYYTFMHNLNPLTPTKFSFELKQY